MTKLLTSRQIKSLIKQSIATYRRTWVESTSSEVLAAKYVALSDLLATIEELENK